MDKDINFLTSFFKDKEDSFAISNITEAIKRLQESSDQDDTKRYIRELFSLIAHFWYTKNTSKSCRELEDSGYNSYFLWSWADGLTGEEWKKDDIITIIQLAILEADFYLRNE